MRNLQLQTYRNKRLIFRDIIMAIRFLSGIGSSVNIFKSQPTFSDGPIKEIGSGIKSPIMKNEYEDSYDIIDDAIDWKEPYKKLEKRVRVLEDRIGEFEREKQSLNDNRTQNRQQAQMQILYRNDGGHLQEVVRELESRLYSTLSQNGITLVHCKKGSDVQPHIPLLIVCMITSRLGVDAKVAIQDLQDLRKAALLIFHHKDSRSLPVNSSENALKEPEYQDLRCIVDFAFQKEKGIYRCDMNENSEETVVNFINTSVDKGTKKLLMSRPDLA